MRIIECGLYSVLDSYFIDFKSEFLVDNKAENRPYYLSFIDKDRLIWLIPLSSQTANYREKINKDKSIHGECIFYHIGRIADKESVFLIGNMFPVVESYIKKPYCVSNSHYILQDNILIGEIAKRVNKYLALVKHGKMKPNLDILKIKELLLEHKKSIFESNF